MPKVCKHARGAYAYVAAEERREDLFLAILHE